MEYKKPEVIAQSGTVGTFAAGCPAKNRFEVHCVVCNLTM